MKKTDYMASVANNIVVMNELKQKYKYMYDKNERKEIFNIARKITRYSPIIVPESKNIINERNLYKNFLSSLDLFESDLIKNYYIDQLERIEISRNKCVKDDEAELAYDSKKNPIEFYICLPITKLTVTNQIGFAHEMGHIPEIEKPRESYFEYMEAIPMFFEYIMALESYSKDKAKDNFLYERLSNEIEEASDIPFFYKASQTSDEMKKLYYLQEFADNYKFLESLDLTLNLIDIFEDDKYTVIKVIENIIEGKSLIDVTEELSIETTGCKRLLKEYKGV